MAGEPNRGVKGRQNWGTPQWLFDRIEQELGLTFELDVCAEPWSAKCDRYFTEETDGLAQSWADTTYFCNPPFRMASRWLEKGLDAALNHNATGAFVLPTSTDTVWFHKLALRGFVFLIQGRVNFVEPPDAEPRYDKHGKLIKNGNNGGSMVVVFHPVLIADPVDELQIQAVNWRKP